MDDEALENALAFILEKYMNMDYNLLPSVLGYEIKQEVGRFNNYIVQIQSNDHRPPHFHVIKKDGTLNAKFTIDDCALLELIKGKINSKDMRRIHDWYKDEKVQVLWDIWRKNKQGIN